jgi:hypothetical protein
MWTQTTPQAKFSDKVFFRSKKFSTDWYASFFVEAKAPSASASVDHNHTRRNHSLQMKGRNPPSVYCLRDLLYYNFFSYDTDKSLASTVP